MKELNEMTQLELETLRNEIDERIHSMAMRVHKDKEKELKEKYEGKIYNINGRIYFIKEVIGDYAASGPVFIPYISNTMNKRAGFMFIENENTNLFSPYRAINGEIRADAEISSAKEVTRQQAMDYIKECIENSLKKTD